MSEHVKKNVDKSGLGQDFNKREENAPEILTLDSSGIACDVLLEPVPRLVKAACEKVIEGQNNTWIVMGRDRPRSRASGYGGAGHNGAGSIDIVVGRMPKNTSSEFFVDPNFVTDAARIHISQKTDIDANFNLEQKIQKSKSTACAGIGIKADAVRIIGRESVKIITGVDPETAGGGENRGRHGIHLISDGNDSDLQPIVLGDNLVKCLEQIIKRIENISGVLSTFFDSQMNYNNAIATHTHTSPYWGITVKSSAPIQPVFSETQMKQLEHSVKGLRNTGLNLTKVFSQYLQPASKKQKLEDPADGTIEDSNRGAAYILSELNKVN